MIDYRSHSVWLSSVPCQTTDNTSQGSNITTTYYTVPVDDLFFHLGGEVSFSYSNSTGAKLVGVYSTGPEGAVFVDSAQGCVSTISLSTVRVNPATPNDTSTSLDSISNKKVIELLSSMRGNNTQLKNGAFILRLYNIRTNMPILSDSASTRLISVYGTSQDSPVVEGDGYFAEYCVFLNSFDYSFEDGNPNVLNISLQMTVRSPKAGYNLGTTSD